MNIGFTGHRDKEAGAIKVYELVTQYHKDTWVWGCAKSGFDWEIGLAIQKFHLANIPFPPQYKDYAPKMKWKAPLDRNTLIVEKSDILIALWDGRETGGTWDTIQKARVKGIEIIHIEPYVYNYSQEAQPNE